MSFPFYYLWTDEYLGRSFCPEIAFNVVEIPCFIQVKYYFISQCSVDSGIEAWSLGPLSLQCFDTAGWVF